MAKSKAETALPVPSFDTPVKVLIVVAADHPAMAEALSAGAVDVLKRAGAAHEIVQVPGALELPTAIALAHRLSNFDGYVALGCVIGDDAVGATTAQALGLLGIEGACLGNGLLQSDTPTAAMAAAQADGDNKGGKAAEAALHLIALSRKWGRSDRDMGFRPAGSFQIAEGKGPTTA